MISHEVKIMREKLQRFMYGRYGMDAFSRFLLVIVLISWLGASLLGSRILNSWSWLLMFYVYYRMFSRNITKRYQENAKYLQIKTKVLSKFKTNSTQNQQRKTHHIYKCPGCKQKLRVPRGRGRIEISCRKCGTKFVKKS